MDGLATWRKLIRFGSSGEKPRSYGETERQDASCGFVTSLTGADAKPASMMGRPLRALSA
jgi:hypothetical protein